MSGPDQRARSAKRAQEALRLIRRDIAQPWRRWPARAGGAVLRAIVLFVRATGEILGEIFGELLVWAAILAVFLLGVVVLALLGWR